jgi:sugar transferase (PEP-CTERM system associated)
LIRLFHAYFPTRTFVLGVSEWCLIVLSFMAATILRLGTTDAAVMLQYEQGLFKILLLSGGFFVCMYYFDLYDSSILRDRREVLTRLIQVLGVVSLLQAFAFYLYPPLELGRGIFLIGLPIVLIVLASWRGLFFALNRQPQFAERTMIFGDEPSASRLSRELASRPELGLHVVCRILSTGTEKYELNCENANPNNASKAVVGGEELTDAIGQQRVNRIIVTLSDRRGRLPVELLLSMKSRGIPVEDGTDLYERVTGKIPIESLRLGTLLFSSGFLVSRFLVTYKRVASILISIVGLILALPLLPFIALAIKLNSPGRILYHQKRVGLNDTIFFCHKFRTMRADAEADTGPTWAGDEDPRITRVGRFLRIARLDEIPQLWNVLKGEMSVVGPRPERPEFIEWLRKEISYYSLRHTIRPGITGWAQIRYRYGSSIEDAKEKLRYDLFYIKHMSPGLDALILLETAKTILLGRGAK